MKQAPLPDPTKRWIISGVLLYVVVIVAVGAGLLELYNASKSRLDEEMGARLKAVASTVAVMVDGDMVDLWGQDLLTGAESDLMRLNVNQAFHSTEVSEITVTLMDGTVLHSASKRLAPGEYNTYWSLDSHDVLEAKKGLATAGPLVPSGAGLQKSAHAPVFDAEGTVSAVVSVEAEADYFDALKTLSRGAFVTGAIVLAILTLIGTVLGRLLRDIMRTRARLAEQEKLASMGRMTAGIAHEIRNPLGIIRGAGELIAMRLEKAGLDAASADFITGEVDRLDRILTRYLAFGRGGGLNPEPLDFVALVRRTVRNMDSELTTTPATVTIHGEPHDVCIDDPAMQQVLLNLLLNARDVALEADDPALVLDLDYGVDSVTLSVKDHGAGLGGRDPEQLFAPFETTKEKGSGLGLAVVRQVAEDHGGSVHISDRADGPGAVATVVLPYAGPNQED
jgi:signal transduction histidine kinase